MGIHQSISAEREQLSIRRERASSSAWTDELVIEASKLWNSGMTAGQVAGKLGRGLTKNSVIGQSHRNPKLFTAKRAAASIANQNKIPNSVKLEASRLWMAGVNAREIAERFGATQGAIENMISRNRQIFPRRDGFMSSPSRRLSQSATPTASPEPPSQGQR